MTSSTLRRTVTRSALALALAAGPALAAAPAAHFTRRAASAPARPHQTGCARYP